MVFNFTICIKVSVVYFFINKNINVDCGSLGQHRTQAVANVCSHNTVFLLLVLLYLYYALFFSSNFIQTTCNYIGII